VITFRFFYDFVIKRDMVGKFFFISSVDNFSVRRVGCEVSVKRDSVDDINLVFLLFLMEVFLHSFVFSSYDAQTDVMILKSGVTRRKRVYTFLILFWLVYAQGRWDRNVSREKRHNFITFRSSGSWFLMNFSVSTGSLYRHHYRGHVQFPFNFIVFNLRAKANVLPCWRKAGLLLMSSFRFNFLSIRR
jgi:hypothetical protein